MNETRTWTAPALPCILHAERAYGAVNATLDEAGMISNSGHYGDSNHAFMTYNYPTQMGSAATANAS